MEGLGSSPLFVIIKEPPPVPPRAVAILRLPNPAGYEARRSVCFAPLSQHIPRRHIIPRRLSSTSRSHLTFPSSHHIPFKMPPRKSKTAAAAAAKPETPAVVGRRRSQRVSTSASASTDKKSRYFTAESEGSEAELDVKATPAPKKRGRPSGSASAKKAPPAKRVKKAAVESEEEEEAGETPFEESQPEEEEEEEEEEVKPVKKAARGRKAKVVIHQDKGEKANVGKRRVAKQVADSDAEDAVPTKKPGRPAAKKTQPPTDDDEEDDDSDARPKVVFIPHAKIRDDGGVPYTDDLVHPNTLEFLKDLKANNVRSWLKCTPPPPLPQSLPPNPPSPSQRRRIPPRPQRLGILRHRPNRHHHRPRPDHPRAPLQRHQLPHLPRHPLHQRPNSLQGTPPFPPPTPIITNPRDSHTSPPPGPAPAAKAPTPAIIYTWNPTARPS